MIPTYEPHELEAERLMHRTKFDEYPVYFTHSGRRWRLELVSRLGPIVTRVMLIDNATNQATMQIDKVSEAIFREARGR